MKTNSRFLFLFAFVFLLLGIGIEAYPLEADISPDWSHGGPNVLSKWQKTYNLTTDGCPYYYENILREQNTTRYVCQLFCAGQHVNSTEFQCLSPNLTKEQAKSQGLLYLDDQGGSWSPGRCHCGEEDVDDGEAFIFDTQAKQPPDITQRKYKMTSLGRVDKPVPGILKWAIASPKSNKPDKIIDVLGYIPGQNTAYVFEAWNDSDLVKRRFKLRDIVAGWYNAKADRPLSNLNSIYLEGVIEGSTNDIMVEMRRDILGGGDNGAAEVIVYASDTEPNRQRGFRRLLTESKFGNGFRKMLEEYSALQGKAIVAFRSLGGVDYGDLEIVLSGSSSGLDEPPDLRSSSEPK